MYEVFIMTMTFTRPERISYLKKRIEELNKSKKKVSNPSAVFIYDRVIKEFEQEIKEVEENNDKYIIVEN